MLPHDATMDPTARDDARALDDRGAALRPPARERRPEDVVAQIVELHHGYERRALPSVVALLAKVAGRHRGRNAKLGVLCDVGQELADALEADAEEGERELFPAVVAGETGTDGFRDGLERTRRRHRALALLLARIRWLADDFAIPGWAGRSYQALMEELEALEEDVLQHVHLEARLLFAGASPGEAAC